MVKQSGYYSIEWDSMSVNAEKELSPERLKRFNSSVNRMNNDLYYMKRNGFVVPQVYYDLSREMVKAWRGTAQWSETDRKNTAVTIAEENFVLDREKARTYYDQNIAAQIFAPVTRGLNAFKWDVKHYEIEKVENAVKQSRRFDNPNLITLQTNDQLDRGSGWYVGYEISRWDIMENQGELFDLQFETVLEASAQMGRFAHEHILTGSTVEHGGEHDSGEAGSGMSMTGFVNNTNVQSFAIADPKTYLNFYNGIKTGLEGLKKVFASRNVVMISSAGLADQVERNRSTFDKKEKMELAEDLIGPGKPIKSWWVTDQVTGAAITNSTQKVWLGVVDPRLMSRLIVLPLQTIAHNLKNWKDDVKEIMLAGDIIRYNQYDTTENAFPATAETDITTTTTGYLTNTRYM